MTETWRSRRAFLREAGVGVACCLAGCVSSLDEKQPPAWLYDPQGPSEGGGSAFSYLDRTAIAAHEQWLASETFTKYENYVSFLQLEELSVDISSVKHVFLTHDTKGGTNLRTAALAGSFDRGSFEERLQEQFESHENHCGFDVYSNADANRGVGVDERQILLGYRTPTHSARETTLAAVDSQRSGDDSSTFETLLETLGPGHDVSGILHGPHVDATPEQGTFEGQIAKGHRYEFQGGECQSRYAFVFESPGDADRDAVSTWVDGGTNGNRLFEAYQRTTIRQNGRIIVVDGTVATQDV